MPLQARPASASDTPLPCTLCPARQGCGKGLWEPLQYATEYTEKTHLLLVTVLAKGVWSQQCWLQSAMTGAERFNRLVCCTRVFSIISPAIHEAR